MERSGICIRFNLPWAISIFIAILLDVDAERAQLINIFRIKLSSICLYDQRLRASSIRSRMRVNIKSERKNAIKFRKIYTQPPPNGQEISV
jgi:hypothetical protein